MVSNPELEARLVAAPDDVAAHLVYSDWLTHAGDPRGELIAVQHARAARPDDAQLAAAEKALLDQHGAEWLGLAAAHPKAAIVEWRLGHVHALRLSWEGNDAYGSGYIEPAELLRAVLERPAGRLLQRVDHELFASEYSAEGVIATLGELRPPSLRELSLADFSSCALTPGDLNGISWLQCGNLAPLYGALPRLESLEVMGVVELGDRVALPSLKRLAVRTGTLRRAAIAALSASELSSLERLEVWFGSANYGAEGGVDDLGALLSGERLPRLTWLGLMNSEFADELPAALARSALLSRLRELDLSMGIMTERGARALVEHADAFRHLERVSLVNNYIEGEAVALLRALPFVDLGEQRSADEDDDGEAFRYVAVGE
jgi:uncharacterized protein (TIGR02996 family)